MSPHSTVKPEHLTTQVCCNCTPPHTHTHLLIIYESCMFEAGGIHVTTAAQIRHSPGRVDPVSVHRWLQSALHAVWHTPHPPTQKSI